MKRKKKLTKKEKKALRPGRQPPARSSHIHCIACGRHIDASEFSVSPVSATYITCDHGSQFPTCVSCAVQAQMLVDQHDRTDQPVKVAQAWH